MDDALSASRRAYLDLLKRALIHYPTLGAGEDFASFNSLRHYDEAEGRWKVSPEAVPLTLLGKGQLDLLETLAQDVVARDVPGDFIEAGVWRGGAVAFLRALVRTHEWRDRKVVAADSFEGIPASTRFPHDLVNEWPDRWVASLDTVKGHIDRLGLLDDGLEFVAGFFAETLPTLTGRRFSLIRLDADAYDSTTAALVHLYPLLSPGGAVIIDDWHLFGCKLAVETWRGDNGVVDPITVDEGNAWWIRR